MYIQRNLLSSCQQNLKIPRERSQTVNYGELFLEIQNTVLESA